MTVRPQLRQTVLDARDVRQLAEFYRELLGYEYRPGDEVPTSGPDDLEWLVLRAPDGQSGLAFQLCEELEPTTWPSPDVPMQLHLDMTVPDTAALEAVHARVLEFGGREVMDRSGDPDEPLYVFADPAGHPFCVFV